MPELLVVDCAKKVRGDGEGGHVGLLGGCGRYLDSRRKARGPHRENALLPLEQQSVCA